MSRHYHDSDCLPNTLESIVDRLDELTTALLRLVELIEEANKAALAAHLDTEHPAGPVQ